MIQKFLHRCPGHLLSMSLRSTGLRPRFYSSAENPEPLGGLTEHEAMNLLPSGPEVFAHDFVPPTSSLFQDIAPVNLFKSLYVVVHDSAVSSWPASIMIVLLGVRISLLYFSVRQQQTFTNQMNNKPKFEELRSQIKELRIQGDVSKAVEVQAQAFQFMRDKDFSPLKLILFAVVPACGHLGAFMGLKRLLSNSEHITSLAAGGMLWFPNLTLADPLGILPVVFIGTLMGGIEVARRMDKKGMAALPRSIRIFTRLSPLILYPIMKSMSCGMLIYCTFAAVLGTVQSIVLKLAPIKKLFRIPERITPPKIAEAGEDNGFLGSYRKMRKELSNQNMIFTQLKRNQPSHK